MCTLYPPQYDTSDVYQNYSAFTVAELGEMLPFCMNVEGKKDIFYLTCDKSRDVWHITYRSLRDEVMMDIDTIAEFEADARAKMLIYLLENNLIKI
jgi:hypothetical protein